MADPVEHLYQHHLRELAKGGKRNADGSISTVYGMTAPDASGRHRMMPTIWDQQALPPDAAYPRAQAQCEWNWPCSFSPARTLYNYMNDPRQHPRMEQDVRQFLSPFGPSNE